jgi:hypothetical protein
MSSDVNHLGHIKQKFSALRFNSCFPHIYVTGRIFSLWTGSTALCFTAARAPLAARRKRILPHTKNSPSSYAYTLQQLKLHILCKRKLSPF